MAPTISLPDGEVLPALGQGTWFMGEDESLREAEIASLQAGLDLGLRVIDTAEMYGGGAAERLVGEAIAGRREEAFIVSKAYPQNASHARLPGTCEASLKRLGTDRIDLYLLHWRGNVPLGETAEAMEALKAAGKIRHWGVSNLDVDEMAELMDAGGTACATDQILYNLTRRGPEYDLLGWLRDREIPVMAYSPIEQGRLLDDRTLGDVAVRHGTTPAVVALAWVLSRPGVMAIPKTGNRARVEANAAAREIVLDEADMAALDRAFAPPTRPVPLEIL